MPQTTPRQVGNAIIKKRSPETAIFLEKNVPREHPMRKQHARLGIPRKRRSSSPDKTVFSLAAMRYCRPASAVLQEKHEHMQIKYTDSFFVRLILPAFIASGLGCLPLPAHAEGNLTSLAPLVSQVFVPVLAMLFMVCGALVGLATGTAGKRKSARAMMGAAVGFMVFFAMVALQEYQQKSQWIDEERVEALNNRSNELLFKREYVEWVNLIAQNEGLDAVTRLTCASISRESDEPDFMRSEELSSEQNHQAYAAWREKGLRRQYERIKEVWRTMESAQFSQKSRIAREQIPNVRQLFFLLAIRQAEWADVDTALAAGARMDDGGRLERNLKKFSCDDDLSVNPLRQAWLGEKAEGVAKILERGAQAEMRESSGENILFSDLTPALIDQLVAKGANVNQRRDDGHTPLSVQLSIGMFLDKNEYGPGKESVEERVARVHALLRNGADIRGVFVYDDKKIETACKYLDSSWENTGYNRVDEANEEMTADGLVALKLYQSLKAVLNGCGDNSPPKK